MAIPKTAIKRRFEIMKDRERERLERFLRVLFGKHIPFFWTDENTSYTDGKSIYVKHDVQTKHHRPFSEGECRLLRKCFALHERGHIEYDYLPDYFDWLEKFQSTNPADWKANVKYPLSWLRFFGNMGGDGRMENMIAIANPSTKDIIDFGNYEWRFGKRLENIGIDRIKDFRSCYGSRFLGMNDLAWHPEAIALCDIVHQEIKDARFLSTTKEGMEAITSIIQKVWPTLLEWHEEENPINNFKFDDPHEVMISWGDKGEVDENAENMLELLEKALENAKSEGEGVGDGVGDDQTSSNNPDFSSAITREEKQLEQDQKEEDQLNEDYEQKKDNVTVPGAATSQKVVITPLPYSDLPKYKKSLAQIKRYILPVSKELAKILEPTPTSIRHNQRSGKLKASKVYRVTKMDDQNIFTKNTAGTPAKNAFIKITADISGSTWDGLPNGKSVIDEIRNSLVLLNEACAKANIPIDTHAFTERSDTELFPLKPTHRFSDVEKGFIGGIRPMSGNRDTLALQWSVDQLKKRSEQIRLLIMLSDGLPCFYRGENEDTMREIVQKAEKEGIDVLCLFIGNPTTKTLEKVRHMYPGKAIIADNNIAKQLSIHVKRIISKRMT